MALEDEEIEDRIMNTIIVDAYEPEERALSWYYYAEDHLRFPFRARCIAERAVSPLDLDQEVEVIGMPSEDECLAEINVLIAYGKKKLAVPLSQLEIIDDHPRSKRVIDDWKYWLSMGYRF